MEENSGFSRKNWERLNLAVIGIGSCVCRECFHGGRMSSWRPQTREHPTGKNSATLGAVLEVIDEEPIRRNALRKCRRAMTDRAKVQEELDQFNEHDRPSYERWMHGTFGAMLSEIRNEEERLFELRELFEDVGAEAFMSGVTEDEAYRRVKERREAEPAGIDEPEESSHTGSRNDERDGEEDEDDFGDPFRDEFGDSREEYAEEMHRRRMEELSGGSSNGDDAGDDIKELYRKLVRRLHPDMNGEVPEKTKELWHAVQEAYRRGDYGRLRELAAQCSEGDADSIGKETPVSRLLAIWKNARAAVQTMRAEIRRARKDPAWGFSQKDNREREKVAASIREEFDYHLEERRSLREELEKQIQIWEALATRRDRERMHQRDEAEGLSSKPPRRRRRGSASEAETDQMRFSF